MPDMGMSSVSGDSVLWGGGVYAQMPGDGEPPPHCLGEIPDGKPSSGLAGQQSEGTIHSNQWEGILSQEALLAPLGVKVLVSSWPQSKESCDFTTSAKGVEGAGRKRTKPQQP